MAVTKEHIAELINGEPYRNEVNGVVQDLALKNRLVIVYGASDDLMCFSGAINDDISAYNGTTAFIQPTGLFQNECECDTCPYAKRLAERCSTIEAVWGKEGFEWTYKTSIPHAKFVIMDEGEQYCRGIVFSLDELT